MYNKIKEYRSNIIYSIVILLLILFYVSIYRGVKEGYSNIFY